MQNMDKMMKQTVEQAAQHFEMAKGEAAIEIAKDAAKKLGLRYKGEENGNETLQEMKAEHGVALDIWNQKISPLVWEAIMIASKNDITEFIAGYVVHIDVPRGVIKRYAIEPSAEQLAAFKNKMKKGIQ